MNNDINLLFQKVTLPHVFMLTGDDTVGREKAKQKIMDSLNNRFNGITNHTFDSSVSPFINFLERIITPSLFQEIRLFSITHAHTLSLQDQKQLSELLVQNFPDEYIIIEYDKEKIKKGNKGLFGNLDVKKIMKRFPDKCALFQFDKPPDYKIADWLYVRVPLFFNRYISKECAEFLINMAGTELEKLYSELQKIDIYLPEKEEITKESIRKISGVSRMKTPFELADALGNKKNILAMEIINSLFMTNFYAPPVIAIIFQHFWKLLKIRAFAKDNKAVINNYYKKRYTEKTKIAHTIGVETGLLRKTDPVNKAYPVMILSNIINQAKNFSTTHLNTIFVLLRDFDIGIKNGRVKPTKQSLQFLCNSLLNTKAENNKEEFIL